MKKKNRHPSPMQYRIRYIVNGSVNESVQYYSVFHSSEAIDFLAHTLRQGHIHGSNIKIVGVEEFNRFSGSWGDRTAIATEFASAPELFLEKDYAWLRKKN